MKTPSSSRVEAVIMAFIQESDQLGLGLSDADEIAKNVRAMMKATCPACAATNALAAVQILAIVYGDHGFAYRLGPLVRSVPGHAKGKDGHA